MRAAGRGNQDRRIGRTASETVNSVGIGPKDRGVAIEADLDSPLERVVGVHITHVLFELVEIPVRSENRSTRRVVALKKPVAEGNCRLRVIGRGKKRRAPDVTQ